ncbi:MAG: hypothetical protein V1890_04115, partial [Candidatus Zixiibacteriota bacterium]
MKKSILIVLLVLLAFTVWTVLVFGKAKQEEATKQPTQIQKVEPGPEAFPQVVLPKAHAVRPTAEDFQKEMLDPKGLTPEMVVAGRGELVPVEDMETLEKELFYCRASGVKAPCCYTYTAGSAYPWCYGQVGIASFTDLDDNFASFPVCPYPLYPFRPTIVRTMINAPEACTFILEARIYGVDYSGGGPYPSGELYTSDQLNPTVWNHVGGTLSKNVDLLASPEACLYGPFFAVIVINNTDDFNDPWNSCPTAPYQFQPSWAFDQSGRTSRSYMNVYGLGGSWYDVVAYGFAPGVIYVQVYGYTAPQNTCPPP